MFEWGIHWLTVHKVMSRSESARIAANVRWAGHVKQEPKVEHYISGTRYKKTPPPMDVEVTPLGPTDTRTAYSATPADVGDKRYEMVTGNRVQKNVGDFAESLAAAVLGTDRVPAWKFLDRNGNESTAADLIVGSTAFEVKGGSAGNGGSARQFRVTIDQNATARERELFARWRKRVGPRKAAARIRKYWTEKRAEAHDRKEALQGVLSRALGRDVKLEQLCVLYNPKTRLASIYRFKSVESRIAFDDPRIAGPKKDGRGPAHVATVKYRVRRWRKRDGSEYPREVLARF